jgi:regulator of CtrA degradation
MDPREACLPRYRIGAQSVCRAERTEAIEDLPEGLLGLLERSERLYDRVLHLDTRMFVEAPLGDAAHPVLSQFERLQAAFGG